MRPLVLAANGSPANDSRGSRFWGYRFRGYRFSSYKFAANWSDYRYEEFLDKELANLIQAFGL